MSNLIDGPTIGAVSDDSPEELVDVDGADDESCSLAVTLSTVMANPSYQPVLLTTRLTVAGALDEALDVDAAADSVTDADDVEDAALRRPAVGASTSRATTDALAAAIPIAFDVISNSFKQVGRLRIMATRRGTASLDGWGWERGCYGNVRCLLTAGHLASASGPQGAGAEKCHEPPGVRSYRWKEPKLSKEPAMTTAFQRPTPSRHRPTGPGEYRGHRMPAVPLRSSVSADVGAGRPPVPPPDSAPIRPAVRTNAKVSFQCGYHIVWCTQYRAAVIDEAVGERLKEVVAEVLTEKGAWLVEVKVAANHVYLVVEVAPQLGVHRLVKAMKAASSRALRQEFPLLRSRLPSLWTNSYHVSTVGSPASAAMVAQYVSAQPRGTAGARTRTTTGSAGRLRTSTRRMTPVRSYAAGMSDVVTPTLPPGPRLPPAVQAALMWRYWPRFVLACRRRYGGIFTLRVASMGTVVYLDDRDEIKKIFAGEPAKFHAGEANSMLTGLLGPDSVLVVDEEVHRDRRRLMLEPFHREAVARQAGLMAEIAAENIATWPVGNAFAVAPRMSQITLEVILRTVIGATDPERLVALREVMPRLLNLSAFQLLAVASPKLLRRWPLARGTATDRRGRPPALRRDRRPPRRPRPGHPMRCAVHAGPRRRPGRTPDVRLGAT